MSRDLADRRGLETDVYEPAEDSRLLASVAVERLEGAERVLEVGTGSGYVAERMAEETGARVIASDVNPHACASARERGVEAVRADLVSPLSRERSTRSSSTHPTFRPIPTTSGTTGWSGRFRAANQAGR